MPGGRRRPRALAAAPSHRNQGADPRAPRDSLRDRHGRGAEARIVSARVESEVAAEYVRLSLEMLRTRPVAAATPLGAFFATWVLRRRAADVPPAALSAAYVGRRNTSLLEDLCPVGEWHRTALFQEWQRPHGLDGGIMSVHGDPGGWAFVITSGRVCGDRPFERRDSKLVHLLQLELARHLGRSLATSRDPVSRLSPRLRETLDRLLDGDSEKQAALRMGLSLATVREYVQALYRHFGVNTRAELMTHFLRRHRGGRPDPPAVS